MTFNKMTQTNSNNNMSHMPSTHPYEYLIRELEYGAKTGKYFDFSALNKEKTQRLPYSIRILLESAVRHCDGFLVTEKDVDCLLNWEAYRGPKPSIKDSVEIPFIPARVLLQDFTGVPCMVDLAALRDAMVELGGDLNKINPQVRVDLVIDHSVQVDKARSSDAALFNEKLEFERNQERFSFLKWASSAFLNTLIVPPASGIVHQVNLEYLANVVIKQGEYIFPDSLVGTDSHTTMIDGLGIAGWGVGGIEAEAVMLGQPLSLVLPPVYGVNLKNTLPQECTATDLVLHITQVLRSKNVVDSFVEYFGEGCQSLTAADRATVANMSPEYGATMGFFPVDEAVLTYLRNTGRREEDIKLVQAYLEAVGLLRTYDTKTTVLPQYTEVIEIDLAQITPCVAGPKRPQDKVALCDLPTEFKAALCKPVGFKGFGLSPEAQTLSVPFVYEGQSYSLKQGSVVISAITSCTNTSNPSVMLGAGLLAKKAVEKGLRVAPYIKTSLSPGSGVVLKYLKNANLIKPLEDLGFFLAGFGCMTCIGNSGDLPQEVAEAIQSSKDLIVASVLSGNRNFEGRVHPQTRANYLASPPLCVAYAIAGRVDIDFKTEPLGVGKNGEPVYLADIWPDRSEVSALEQQVILPEAFKEIYSNIKNGSPMWRSLTSSTGSIMQWPSNSTYIHKPPFFEHIELQPKPIEPIKNAHCLVFLGDSVTTDHISPAGRIEKDSPAGKYLLARGVDQKSFNSYGSRRGNDEIMMRGTFANIRLINKLVSNPGPITLHVPTGEQMTVFDAAELYKKENMPLIVIAGKEYGSGSSRDWAAKGVYMLGVRCIIAESFERIHRSNLVGMGILPLEFLKGENATALDITGKETFSIDTSQLEVKGTLSVQINSGERSFSVKSRIDTQVEMEYFKAGGVLQYVLRKLATSKQ